MTLTSTADLECAGDAASGQGGTRSSEVADDASSFWGADTTEGNGARAAGFCRGQSQAAGEDARAVTVIADACNLHNKTLVGLVVPQDGTSDADVTESLNHLRPFTRMLVVASGVDYVEAMLQALRA